MTERNTAGSGAVSTVVAIVIVAAVAAFLLTGDITVDFEDTYLKINSTYWADLDMSYSEIDTAAYRKDLDVGERKNGLGSARLSLGTFQNEEFGSYTLYAYTGAKEFIVLTSDGKTLVIGMSSAKDTQTVYETVLERTGR